MFSLNHNVLGVAKLLIFTLKLLKKASIFLILSPAVGQSSFFFPQKGSKRNVESRRT